MLVYPLSHLFLPYVLLNTQQYKVRIKGKEEQSREKCRALPYIYIGPVGNVFANGMRDLGSIPVRVIPKTLKMVLDTSFRNTQQYKVRIKGKEEQSRKRSSTLPYTSV